MKTSTSKTVLLMLMDQPVRSRKQPRESVSARTAGKRSVERIRPSVEPGLRGPASPKARRAAAAVRPSSPRSFRSRMAYSGRSVAIDAAPDTARALPRPTQPDPALREDILYLVRCFVFRSARPVQVSEVFALVGSRIRSTTTLLHMLELGVIVLRGHRLTGQAWITRA